MYIGLRTVPFEGDIPPLRKSKGIVERLGIEVMKKDAYSNLYHYGKLMVQNHNLIIVNHFSLLESNLLTLFPETLRQEVTIRQIGAYRRISKIVSSYRKRHHLKDQPHASSCSES